MILKPWARSGCARARQKEIANPWFSRIGLPRWVRRILHQYIEIDAHDIPGNVHGGFCIRVTAMLLSAKPSDPHGRPFGEDGGPKPKIEKKQAACSQMGRGGLDRRIHLSVGI